MGPENTSWKPGDKRVLGLFAGYRSGYLTPPMQAKGTKFRLLSFAVASHLANQAQRLAFVMTYGEAEAADIPFH
jgi:hypothetical protein